MKGRLDLIRVVCTAVDERDGSQTFQRSTDPKDIFVLARIDRNQNVEIGDVGYLRYQKYSPSHMGYFFIPD